MKKRLFPRLFVLTVLAILIISLVIAADETAETTETTGTTVDTSQDAIAKAYSCLESKVEGRCVTLSAEEKIFVLMAVGKCKDEVIADSVSNEYWTSASPSIKMTAQAILALDKATTIDTTPAQEWLLTQQGSPEDVDWYLQIESTEESTCTVTYEGLPHTVKLSEDKTLNKGAGNCLTLAQDDYWLKITPGCYEKEFEISCDEDFLTSLLFKRQTSSVIHVSDQTNPASANGRTTEKVSSACFLQGGQCDYEGTLWATLVLGYEGHDQSLYLPYLTTMAEENLEYLPESFLYLITASSDYRTDLLSKQRNNKYWDAYKDKFYDTAIALYSISDESAEKTYSKDWLLEIQGSDGCWENHIRNTAFILASVWPKQINLIKSSCEGSGSYCMAEINCEGNLLDSYDCPGVLKCCDSPKPILSCAEQTGEVCNVGESCVAGSIDSSAKGLGTGEICCIGGACEVVDVESECKSYGGTCRPFECSSGEQESAQDCKHGDLCCIPGASKEKGGLGWIWILLFLILLTVLGIVFRKKLRALWNKIRKKGPGGPRGLGGPGGIGRPGMGPRGPRPGMGPGARPARRIFPPGQRRPGVRPPRPPSKPGQVDNVLGKLKQMTK